MTAPSEQLSVSHKGQLHVVSSARCLSCTFLTWLTLDSESTFFRNVDELTVLFIATAVTASDLHDGNRSVHGLPVDTVLMNTDVSEDHAASTFKA
jgi:hypothetical protein